jgi:hypothetical protein
MTSPLSDEDYLSLPTSWLVELITHSPPGYLWDQPLLSRLPNIPDFSPRVVRYEIGVLLKERDKTEDLVKVFLYSESHHAEVWLKNEWDQSNTYYFKLKESSAEYQKREDERKEKWNKVSEFVASKMGLTFDSHQEIHMKMVRMLLSATNLPSQLSDLYPGIKDLLTTYGNLKS